jgi:membrane-anchored glycerophosphoryl diester phosphodiesterase (GDPDase)
MGVISWFLGGNVPIRRILGFAGYLLTVSSIIFGIVGAWIAIIWTKRDSNSVKFLRTIIFILFFVILSCLLILFVYPLLIGIPILSQENIIIWLRKAVVLIFGILLMFLIAALIYAALALDFFSFDEDIEKQSKLDDIDYLERQTSQMKKIGHDE